MAGEDIQITVGVSGNKDIKILNDNVNKVEASVKRLSAGVDSGRISMGAYEKALEQQVIKLKKLKFGQDEANKAVEVWSKNTLESIAIDKASAAAKQEAIAASKAEKEARKAASDAAKIEKAIKQEAALAAKQEALSVKTLADAERDLQVARKQIIASAQQQAAIEDQLRTKYQSGYAELQLYKRENEQLNLAYQKNIITAVQLRAEQDKLSSSFARGTGIFSTYATQASTGMNKFGVVAQQTGYQVSDFIVQVQSGANPLVAFSQQATQLAGLLYYLPERFQLARFAVLGFSVSMAVAISAVTIGIPLLSMLAMNFFSSGKNADKGAEGIETYAGALKALTEEIKNAQQEFLKLKFDTQSLGVAGAKQQLQELGVRLKGLTALRDRLIAGGGQAAAKVGLLGIEGLEAEIAVLEEQLGVLQQIEVSQNYIEASRKRASREPSAPYKEEAAYAKLVADEAARTEELARLKKNVFHAMAGEMGAVSSSTLDALNAQKALNAALSSGDADSFNKAMNDALDAGVRFSQLDLSTVVAMAAKNGWGLAGAMRAAWAAAQGGPLVNANPAAGPSFEGGGRNRNVIPPQKYQQTFQDILNSQTKGGGGGGGGGQTQEDYLQQLLKEDEQKRKLIGLSEAEQSAAETEFNLREKLRDLKGSVTEEEIQSTLRQIEATNKLIEQEARREEMIKSASSTIENAFMSMVDGSKSISDAFKGMVREILLDIYRQQVAKPIATFLSNAIFGSANGNVFSNGSHVTAYANGGVVGSPTYFPMSGGKTGLMGEAGPEAIMPLKRGANGKLGVQVSGNGGSNDITVQNVITVTGSDAAMVRAEVAKMIPQITNATKAAVIDARLRGGQMKQAFR